MDTLSTKKIIKDHSLLGHEDIRRQIRVLPELKELIPPLLPDELKQLENNIQKDGCREALLVWETRQGVLANSDDTSPVYILVDGHNRYDICQRYKIDFRINLKPFSGMDEVRTFMIENQLGRRNLTPEQTAYLRGLRYRDEKGIRGKYHRSNHKGQNVPYAQGTSPEAPEIASPDFNSTERVSTAQKLARQFKVNEKTIKRDAEFAAGVDKLSLGLKTDVLSGKVKANKTFIQQLGKSDVADGSITTLDDVTANVPPTSSPKKAATNQLPSTLPTPDLSHEALHAKLKQLVDQIPSVTTESLLVFDEIIACATQLKAALLKKS